MICFDCSFLFSIEKDLGFISQKEDPAIDFEEELVYFPIPVSSENKNLTCSFVDSWNGERNYGGDRVHEGCDIITSVDTPGIYPVVSISDGVVEKLGWLELGGYRVGIRTDSGLYLYYAHLESYAPDLKEGDRVNAGDCLGFVGDSGYGEEGTTGMFVTHLHMGFYVPVDDVDEAINPYPYLVTLQNHQLKYNYQEP